MPRRLRTTAFLIATLASLDVLLSLVPLPAVHAQGVIAGRKRNRYRIPTNFRRIDIVVTDTGTIVPASTTEGIQTFILRERGAKRSHALLIRRIPAGVSEGEARHAVSTGKLDALELRSLGGPGIPDTSGTSAAQVDLRPGRYLIAVESFDERGRRHVAPRDVGVLLAVGITRVNVAIPPPTHSRIRLTDDEITLSRTIDAGQNILQVDNVGSRDHELVIRHLAAGATRADAFRWLDTRKGPAPFTPNGGATRMSRGRTVYIYLPFEPGDYLLSCDLPGHGHELSKVITVK